VLGHPIAHSLSPVLHRAAYAALGLTGWTYELHDVTVEQLPRFLAGLTPGWAGLSLTMPLKVAVLDLVEHVEPLAQVVGAANTVLIDGAGRAVVAANTDVHGIVAALRETGVTRGSSAAVPGGGATAASALAALAELGVSAPSVYVRSVARAGALVPAAARMGVQVRLRPWRAAAEEVGAVDLVVSTVPGTAADELAGQLGDVRGVLLDARYDERPTPLVAAWRAGGAAAVGGERMLLHQAAEQVRLMTGRTAPIEMMDAALAAALTSR
jgi:shikimate dehydrogenase